MAIIGYIRVSSEQQDFQSQKHALLEYAQQQKLLIDEFIEIEISSRKNTHERRIDELVQKLKKGDTLLVTELSRLGRNMLETLRIIDSISQKEAQLIFIRQPELSINATHSKLMLAIYSYFAEAERDFISMRTKQGLAAIKAKGQTLGRPKGSRNKKRQDLEQLKEVIQNYLKMDFSMPTITRLLNMNRQEPFSVDAVKYFIREEFKTK